MTAVDTEWREEDSNLVKHAKSELDILGETDPWSREAVLAPIRAFARSGHSGGSASVVIPMLERLLSFKPLSPLTDDPREWQDVSEFSGVVMYQSRRDSEAFSTDGGVTYYLLSERDVAGSMEMTPLHRSVHKEDLNG